MARVRRAEARHEGDEPGGEGVGEVGEKPLRGAEESLQAHEDERAGERPEQAEAERADRGAEDPVHPKGPISRRTETNETTSIATKKKVELIGTT